MSRGYVALRSIPPDPLRPLRAASGAPSHGAPLFHRMKLEKMTPAHVKQAVAIYVDHAWPDGPKGAPRDAATLVANGGSLKELRGAFQTSHPENGSKFRRYCLRLGNHRYPWMKFVVQEYLVGGEFFFSVDTHDEMKVDPSMPDYGEWIKLRDFNRDLKREIEEHWARVQLPTHGDLRALCEGLARVGADEPCPVASLHGKRVLVVDDDEDIARSEAAMLEARGFCVEAVFDGQQVIDRMARDPLPDLVVLDYAMPKLDGEQVMERLRADPRTAAVPLLLATASELDLSILKTASGLLKKPYPRAALYAMVDRLLAASQRA